MNTKSPPRHAEGALHDVNLLIPSRVRHQGLEPRTN